MKMALDYSEETAVGLCWKDSETTKRFSFTPFFVEKTEEGEQTELKFVSSLVPGDELYLEGISVTDTLAFLASQRGAKVFRIFAPDLKKVRSDAGLEKKNGTAQALYEATMNRPELFRAYVPIPPDLHLLRRWTRMHFRFQKRFRTGLQATLRLLEKEVAKYAVFGEFPDSKVAAEVKTAIDEVLKLAESLEEKFLREVERSLKSQPLWEVLKKITGIGPKIGAKIIAGAGPRARFKNRDHFIAACGLHVKNGKAPRREAGVAMKRDALLWEGFLQFMRGLHFHDCEWREMYLKKKDEYLARGFSKLRADRAARRFTGTHLARRIWKEWQAVA